MCLRRCLPYSVSPNTRGKLLIKDETRSSKWANMEALIYFTYAFCRINPAWRNARGLTDVIVIENRAHVHILLPEPEIRRLSRPSQVVYSGLLFSVLLRQLSTALWRGPSVRKMCLAAGTCMGPHSEHWAMVKHCSFGNSSHGNRGCFAYYLMVGNRFL